MLNSGEKQWQSLGPCTDCWERLSAWLMLGRQAFSGDADGSGKDKSSHTK